MGLQLVVGNPSDVFNKDYAAAVRLEIDSAFPGEIVMAAKEPRWESAELAWSSWGTLQDMVRRAIGDKECVHFCSMEAWNGVFLPTELTPAVLTAEGQSEPLDLAGLRCLISELHAFALAAGLPTDESGLAEFDRKYSEDDDLDDEGLAFQTFAQLIIAASEASRRRQGLWVVK